MAIAGERMDPVTIAVAAAGLFLSAIAAAVAWSAESRSRRTDRRLQLMDTPQLQATYVDSSYSRVEDRTRIDIRLRLLNPGFVNDSILSAVLVVDGFGEASLEVFGKPAGAHGEDLDTDGSIGSPDNQLFDFVFEFPRPLALDTRPATLTLTFLRHPQIPVEFRFPP